MHLYHWQEECLDTWAAKGYEGIVNVVTGAGKTFLALAAIQRLEALPGCQGLRVKIIVPKAFLVRQWFSALKEQLNIPREEIGFFSGSVKSSPTRKYMIYVINSARYSFSRHILEDKFSPLLIVADECHHYSSKENSKIFDFIKIVPNNFRYYTLGLSATPHFKHHNENLKRCLGTEIYRLNFVQALEADIISPFSLINIGLEFSGYESMEYADLYEKIGIVFFRRKRPLIML